MTPCLRGTSETLRIFQNWNPLLQESFVIPWTIVSEQLFANNDSKLMLRRKQTDQFDILWEAQYLLGFSSHLLYICDIFIARHVLLAHFPWSPFTFQSAYR